jgi:hypothetical protein
MRPERRRSRRGARRDYGPEHVIRRALERWGIAITFDDVRELEALVRAAIAGDGAGARLVEVQSAERSIWIVRFAGAWRELVVDERGRVRSAGGNCWPLEVELGAGRGAS